jgi:transposase/transcriptional regulator with XRE-family HTH domain
MTSMEEQRAEKFYELKQQGITEDEIASTYFLSASQVRKIIRDYEKRNQIPHIHKVSSSTPRMSEFAEKAEEYYELQLKGATAKDIASMYGVSAASVYYATASYRREHQLPDIPAKTDDKPIVSRVRGIAQQRGDQRGEEFRELRLKGVTLEDIASMNGITRERVRQIIARYERDYNLPSSKHIGGSLADRARQADIEEYRAEQIRNRMLQQKHGVETIQLDAELVGRFLHDLEHRRLSYRNFARYAKRKDGTPHPSSANPTHVRFRPRNATKEMPDISLHRWVLSQHGIDIPEKHHCHHIDGDITNNMLENLQVLSNIEHGRITMLPYMPPKFTDEQVEEMRGLYREQRHSVPQLAKMYGGSANIVYNALYGNGAYRHINPSSRCAPLGRNSPILRILTIAQVEELRMLYKSGVNPTVELAKTYNVSLATIYKALYGYGSYSDINPSTRCVKKEKDPRSISPRRSKVSIVVDGVTLNRCPACNQEFPATPEFFYRNKQMKDGLESPCKECTKQRVHGHQKSPEARERDRIRHRRTYYQKHKVQNNMQLPLDFGTPTP